MDNACAEIIFLPTDNHAIVTLLLHWARILQPGPRIMRALYITCSAQHPRLPFRLFDEQIVVGPTWPDAQTIGGCWRSLRTTLGDYDLIDILQKIPASQFPDLLVCFGDASGESRPRNLQVFHGPKIMALPRGLSAGLNWPDFFHYLSKEPFDHVFAADTDLALAELLQAERQRLGGFRPDTIELASARALPLAAAC